MTNEVNSNSAARDDGGLHVSLQEALNRPHNGQVALACVRVGLAVVPWRFVGKRKVPYVTDWQLDATRDEGIVMWWWCDEFPSADVGVVTGEEYDLWVLDVDVQGETHDVDGLATLRELERVNGPLPRTFTVRTASGGLHLYFRWPRGRTIVTGTNTAGVGLDTRGQGGFVAAPSTRVFVTSANNHVPYVVEVDGVEVAYAPDWLVDLCVKRQRGGRAVTAYATGDGGATLLAAETARLAATTSGRNATLNTAAYLLASCGSVTRDDAHRELRDACDVNGLNADDGTRQFDATFNSGWCAGEVSDIAQSYRALRQIISEVPA